MATTETTQYGFDPAKIDGATRIGIVWLHVPPINIHFSDNKFDKQMMTIRQPSPNYIKSGRQLWSFDMDIVFSGVNMINEKLARIIAQVRRSSFTMLRNETVQKIISYETPTSSLSPYGEIPIAVTGYTIHTEVNLPETIIMRLSFIIFNYGPYVRSMKFLRQELATVSSGTSKWQSYVLRPAPKGIIDSNLYQQYIEGNPENPFIVEHEQLQDIMFAGELEYTGTHTEAQNAKWKSAQSTLNTAQSDKDPSNLVSRTEKNNHGIIRNGDRIKRVSSKKYVGSNQSIDIGYHVFNIRDALDLRLGAYQSRQDQKWKSTELERRADILTYLGIPDTGQSLSPIVDANMAAIAELPVVNNASLGGTFNPDVNKYIKKFTIRGDSSTVIQGITVRHTVPLSVVPIISCPVPTVQYMGGAASTIIISMETTSESFIETLTAVDQTIESSARHKRRHSGSELTYVDNDIINLNGTFVIGTSDLSIESIEGNQGAYVVTYILNEQAEVLSTLSYKATEIPQLKKKLIAYILSQAKAQAWNYSSAYDSTGKLNLTGSNPSYLEIIIFPSWLRTIRNAFLKDFTSNNPYSSLDIDRLVLDPTIASPGTPTATAPTTPAGTASGPVAIINNAFVSQKQAAYNAVWKVITGQNDGSNDTLYGTFYSWILSKGNSIPDAVATILAESDNRRFEALLRSPKLLEYELRLISNKLSLINFTEATGRTPPLSFSAEELNTDKTGSLRDVAEFFSPAYSNLQAYPDLGLPFKYKIEDNNGLYLTTGIKPPPFNIPGSLADNSPVPASGVQYIAFDQPGFYIEQDTILPPSIAESIRSDYFELKSKINKDNKGTKSNPGLSVIFGDGQAVAAHATVNQCTSNKTVGLIPATDGLADGQATNQKKNSTIGMTDSDISVNAMSDYLTKAQNDQNPTTSATLAFGRINAFKSTDDLFLSSSMASSLGLAGAQTSDKIIAETQEEHKTFKSSLVDFNPDLDHTVAGIIKDAQDDLLDKPNYYSLNKAFPTYKFYFKIEGNPHWNLFDNFYDYRAIESIRYYKDKATPAAVLNIVLNNYNEILTDYAAVLAKVSYKEKDRNNTYRVQDVNSGKPLSSFSLEAGMQVQLRVGYDANPDNLTTIFNGFITDISPGEHFEIICQSYGAELLTDADMGTFSGWICPPRFFIEWMLLNPKVKHLGTLFQPTMLPTGAHDYIDGFTFDDNIYINQSMEPGKYRIFQVYNSDNMSMWDVLQDIAAAHPGYICQTVNFDDRETLFFGRPDHFYKYTQDLGTVARYPKDIINNFQARLTEAKQTGLAVDVLNQLASNTTEAQNNNSVWLNYMQWLSIGNALSTAMDAWKSDIEDDGLSTQYENLFTYCKWVEVLQSLAADKNCGNIEYDISNNNASVSTKDDGGTEEAASPGNQSVATPSISSQVANQAPTPSASYQPTGPVVNTDSAPVALSNHTVTDKFGHIVPPDRTLISDNYIYNNLMASLYGKHMTLDQMVGSVNARSIYRSFGSGNILQSADPNIGDNQYNTLLQDYNTATVAVQQRLTNHDNSLLTSLEATVAKAVGTIAGNTQQFAEQYGIANAIAILAWFNICDCLLRMMAYDGKIALSNVRDILAGNLDPDPFKALVLQNTGQFGIQLPGIRITVGARSNQSSIQETSSNGLLYMGDILETNLTAHAALRQLILTTLNDISPQFQDMVYLAGQSPITQRFRKYHLKTSYQHIVNNEINVNYMGMWNCVKVKYKRNDLFDYDMRWTGIPSLLYGDKPNTEFKIQAGDTLYDRITRETTVTVENARTIWQARAYATSILAEGIRNMYRGEIVFTGDPDVKPTDIVFVYDDYNKMYGPIEVKSVTHLLDNESGFITIVEPQAYAEPLGVSVSAAQIIFDIFNTLLVPLIFLGSEIGIVGDAINGAKGIIGSAISAGLKNTAKDLATKAVTRMGIDAASMDAALGEFGPQYTREYAATFERNFTSSLKSFLSSNPRVGNFSTINPFTILDQINTARTAAGLPLTDGIAGATRGEINDAITALSSSTPSASAIKSFSTKMALNQTTAAVRAASTTLSTTSANIVGLIKNSSMFSIINTVKLLAVVAPIAYYQVFAGIDDSNYACPLRITPLSFNGAPYTAGLEGLTHQYGIWNHILGQWHRFIGSVRTLGDVLDEYAANVQSVIDTNG